jgi:hypothetical protein
MLKNMNIFLNIETYMRNEGYTKRICWFKLQRPKNNNSEFQLP